MEEQQPDEVFALFDATMEDFRASLSLEDRGQFQAFSTPTAMIADLKSHIREVQHHRMGQLLFRRISKISERWQPYFDSLQILASAYPQYCAFFWGAVRFIFLIGRHYVTFFEKIIDLFDEISQKVAIKTQHLKQIEEWQQRTDRKSQTGLLTILGAIFHDAILFCKETNRIFGSTPKGLRKKLRILDHVLWVPFDKRYAEILTRMAKHEVAFAEELKLTDTRISVSCHALLYQYIEEARLDQQQRSELDKESNELSFQTRLVNIRTWIGGTEYMRIFENVNRDLGPGTCSWFLSTRLYQNWLGLRESVSDSESVKDSGSFLSVLGAPGYGKTVLSVAVIHDLNSRRQNLTHGGMSSQCVLFFHFHQSRSDEDSSSPAFRSILAQLLFQRQNDKELLNAMLMLMYTKGSGQSIASDDQVDEVLFFGLRSGLRTFIVVDGVDECSDQASFFRRLRMIQSIDNCHLMIFCRPIVNASKELSRKHIQYWLKRGENYSAIEEYVRPHILEMIESGMIPNGHDGKELARQIAQRSSSLFLWAKLMINYLECIALTPRDRADAIMNMTSFEGLDNIFEKIILSIHSQPLRQRETAFRVFQLLKVSYHPLTVDQLEAATAVHCGRATSKELDYIVNFENSIVQICGALIEVCNDRQFDFVHTSVAEYLVRRDAKWIINPILAHSLAANICLSYLVNDVPPSPLAGCNETVSHPLVVGRALPLLSYASRYWTDHTAYALKSLKDANQWQDKDIREALISLQSSVKAFLNSNNTICAWIEACYVFQRAPRLHDLVNAANLLRYSQVSDFEGGQSLLQMVERICQLSRDLSALDREWAHILASEPNEIWSPSIRLFTNSQFWGVENSLDKLTRPSYGELNYLQGEDNSSSFLLLMTKTSVKGDKVASLMLLPPKTFTDQESGFFAAARNGLFNRKMRTISRYVEDVSHQWSIRYQLRQSENLEEIERDVTLDVPPEEISFMLYDSIVNGKANPGRIETTCSISDDLQDISVMHSMFRVSPSKGDVDIKERGMQIIDCSLIEAFVKAWDQDISLQCMPHPHWTWTLFSPYGFYFVAFEENGRLTLYEESPFRSNCEASWKHVAQADSVDNSIPVFHPHQPLICLKKENSTYVCSSKSPASWDLYKILPFELESAAFSTCGQYLEGYRSEDIGSQEPQQKIVTLSLSNILDECSTQNDAKELGGEISTTTTSQQQNQWQLNKSGRESELIGTKRDHNGRQKLQQYEFGAALIWESPAKERRTVLRLPRSLASTKISAIATLSEKDKSRIFVHMDKDQQQFYDLRRPANEQFPMVLERHTNTLKISNSRNLPQWLQLMSKMGQISLSQREQRADGGSARISSHALISEIHRYQSLAEPIPGFGIYRNPEDLLSQQHPLSRNRAALPRTALSPPVAPATELCPTGHGPVVTVKQQRRAATSVLLQKNHLKNLIQFPKLWALHDGQIKKIQYWPNIFLGFSDFSRGLFCGLFFAACCWWVCSRFG